MATRKTWIDSVKGKLPDAFAPVVDAYAPVLVDMTAEQVTTWLGLVIQKKSRSQKAYISRIMSSEEVARATEAQRDAIKAIGGKFADRRRATAAFWTGFKAVGLQLLSAYISSMVGVPVAITY